MVLASWASAADTPPTLQAPAKAPAAAAPSKAPGTVAAPTPPTLSYLQSAATAPGTKPASAPPAVAPAKQAGSATAATVDASKKAPAAPEACPAAADTKACVAPATPPKKPAVKPFMRQVKKATPALAAAPAVKAADGFDFRFNGDMWTAMQLLAVKHGPLEVSKQGTVFPIPVKLDLQGVSLIDALAALGEQGGNAADVVYNHDSRTAKLVYRDKAAVSAFIAEDAPKANAARPQPPTQAAVPVSPIDEAKSWQQGGVARPIMGQDGLLLYPFGQSQPTLTCMPLRACDIQLQAGELINNVIFGDTVRWVASPATTGNGTQATPHVIVKPTEVNLETNLLITTNRRSYMLTLKASEGKYVSRIGYYYPQDMVQDWNGQVEAERRKAEEDTNRKISDLPIASIDQLNLDSYTIKGDRTLPWYPVRVFDEGTHVWIQMPASIKASEAPALVLIGNSGASELVNYRVKEADQGGAKVTYYIVDKLFNKAALIIGVGNDQQKIEIVKASKNSWFNLNN